MTKETLERAMTSSLFLMLVLATLDLAFYTWFGSAFLTVFAHALSLWLFFRHKLMFDLIKLAESSALFFDVYLFVQYGYAIASPIATLFVIIHVSMNKTYHLQKLENDLNRVLSSKNKNIKDEEQGKGKGKPEA